MDSDGSASDPRLNHPTPTTSIAFGYNKPTATWWLQVPVYRCLVIRTPLGPPAGCWWHVPGATGDRSGILHDATISHSPLAPSMVPAMRVDMSGLIFDGRTESAF